MEIKSEEKHVFVDIARVEIFYSASGMILTYLSCSFFLISSPAKILKRNLLFISYFHKKLHVYEKLKCYQQI